jgi:hypothetical protein
VRGNHWSAEEIAQLRVPGRQVAAPEIALRVAEEQGIAGAWDNGRWPQ